MGADGYSDVPDSATVEVVTTCFNPSWEPTAIRTATVSVLGTGIYLFQSLMGADGYSDEVNDVEKNHRGVFQSLMGADGYSDHPDLVGHWEGEFAFQSLMGADGYSDINTMSVLRRDLRFQSLMGADGYSDKVLLHAAQHGSFVSIPHGSRRLFGLTTRVEA